MADTPDHTTGWAEPRRTWVLPLVSCVFSLAAFSCQWLYVGWHWRFFWLRVDGVEPPAWMSWTLIDSMHLLAMLFAVCAFATAIVAMLRGALVGGLVALVISLPVGWFAMLIA